jgi:hypothetical protein
MNATTPPKLIPLPQASLARYGHVHCGVGRCLGSRVLLGVDLAAGQPLVQDPAWAVRTPARI